MPPFFAHGCAYAGRPWMATSSIRSNCIHLNITGNSNSHCFSYAKTESGIKFFDQKYLPQVFT